MSVNSPARAEVSARPRDLPALLQEVFGFAAFRQHQDAICRAITAGRDALVVMPTGTGKSLCYQLPGLARGGTTLVICPLIALMEDQVQKLRQLGLAAERIHSGRSRLESREVCHRYLAGSLDFLFIAPERLRVPGFAAFLARRTPSLIAVDEAHCISQWGHDFRPDYRRLREHLPALRPAPIVALTATATPAVQSDIATQLGIGEATRFVHGFRRSNIAIECVDQAPSMRNDTVLEILSDPARLPAIVYAPTRKQAEALTGSLGKGHRSAAYHAGQPATQREATQIAFQQGDLDVIVATVAFGMGIDKANIRTVIHTALPSSVEGYYQEIGRAGRDGAPSRAILLQSYADRRTHEFFFERDYPEPKALAQVFERLSDTGIELEPLRDRCGLELGELERLLEKLVVHGGAIVDDNGHITRGHRRWQKSYDVQRRHKESLLDEITRFADGHLCRMVQLVRYFGDQQDDGADCGVCDRCHPQDNVASRERPLTAKELSCLGLILQALVRRDDQSSGRLFREELEPRAKLDRRAYEELVGVLVRARLVAVYDDVFQKDGRDITYQRLALTPDGRKASRSSEALAARVAASAVSVAAKGKPKRRR